MAPEQALHAANAMASYYGEQGLSPLMNAGNEVAEKPGAWTPTSSAQHSAFEKVVGQLQQSGKSLADAETAACDVARFVAIKEQVDGLRANLQPRLDGDPTPDGHDDLLDGHAFKQAAVGTMMRMGVYGIKNQRQRLKALTALLMMLATQQAGCMEHNVGGKTAADVFAEVAVRQLAQAACRGDAAEVRTVVNAGASPNAAGLRGLTPLAWAVSCNSVPGVSALLAAGADPNQPIGDDFSSVVYVAADRNEPGPLQVLLDAGANANAYDLRSERTAIGQTLSRGINSGDWRHWELMLGKADLNRPYNKLGRTIANDAAALGQFDRVVELLDRGYRYNLKSLARTLEVREVPAAHEQWKRRAMQRLEELGVRFPVGPVPPQVLPASELQHLPANRR